MGYGLSAVTKLGLLGVGSRRLDQLRARRRPGRQGHPYRAAGRADRRRQPAGRLGRAFGVHRALDTAGAMLGPLLAFLVLLAVPGGYDPVFVVSFGVAVLGLAVLVLFVPDTGGGGARRGPRPSLRAVGGLMRGRRVLAPASSPAGCSAWSRSRDGFVYLCLQRRMRTGRASSRCFLLGTRRSTWCWPSRSAGWPTGSAGGTVFIAGHVGLVVLLPAARVGPGWLACVGSLALLGAYYAATDGVLSATAAGPAAGAAQQRAGDRADRAGQRPVCSSLLFGLLWTVTGSQRGGLAAFTWRWSWCCRSRRGCCARRPARPGRWSVSEPEARRSRPRPGGRVRGDRRAGRRRRRHVSGCARPGRATRRWPPRPRPSRHAPSSTAAAVLTVPHRRLPEHRARPVQRRDRSGPAVQPGRPAGGRRRELRAGLLGRPAADTA